MKMDERGTRKEGKGVEKGARRGEGWKTCHHDGS